MGVSRNRRRQLAVMSAEAMTPDDGQAARAATVAGGVQRTQLKTTPLGTTDLEESIEAIRRALQLGVNWIDTAAAYGFCNSEQVVARAIEELDKRPYAFTKEERWGRTSGVFRMETSTLVPASVDQVPTEGPAPNAPHRRRLKRSTRIALVVILIMAVIAGAGFGVSYFLNASNYVSTDNAQIDGNKTMINAPASGRLEDWRISQGSTVQQTKSLAASRYRMRSLNR
jgi:hypothetical protein